MIAFTCPGCRATFNLPDEAAGKAARCSRCNHRFTVPAGAGQPAAAPAPKPIAAAVAAGPKKVALNPIPEVVEAVEVVEEPAVRRGTAKPIDEVEVVDVVDRVEVVDDDTATIRRRSAARDDDDDDYGRPRRSKRRRKESGSSLGLIIGCIVGGVVLVAGIVVVIVVMANRRGAPVNAGGPPDVNANGGGNVVNPAGAAGPGVILDRRDQHTRGDPFDPLRPGCRAKRYTVNLDANRTYKIEMIAQGRLFGNPFDPFLRLEHNGATVAQDDDSGGGVEGLDALIIFRPQQTGAYVIVATAFDQQMGSYRLVVTGLP